MSLATTLSSTEYWVFPLIDLKKAPMPPALGGRGWGQVMDLGTEGRVIAAAALETCPESTGSVVCLQPTDKYPLAVLDVDNYGADEAAVWASLGCDGAVAPYVRTASGGYHFWFRVPEGQKADDLPSDFDLGAGAKGEIRASRRARQLLVLPGSCALNKFSKKGVYTATGFPQHLRDIPPMPDTLWVRLKARQQATGPVSVKLPTELIHMLELLKAVRPGALERGNYNNTIAHVGQIAGRITGWDKPSSELAQSVYEVLSGWLVEGESFKDDEFYAALNSGFRKGRKNREDYQPRDKHPTVTDVLTECRNLFGGPPWLVEMVDPTGKTQDWLLGIGGSSKDRDNAHRTVTVTKVDESWVALCQLGSVDLDVASQSPLHIMPGWRKALHLHLMATRAVDHQGLPPEVRFWQKMAELVRDAAKERCFLRNRNASRQGQHQALHIPATGPPEIILFPDAQTTVTMYTRDNRVVNRARRQFCEERKLAGMKRAKAWIFPLRVIAEEADDPDLVEWVVEQYVNYRKQGDDNE